MPVNQFSNKKIFYYGDRILEAINGSITEPVVYELSLSGKCNCSCEYCCCKHFKSDDMLSEKDIDILAEELSLNHAEAVTITGGGEPLTNPFFCYCVKQLRTNHISVGLITNGLLLNEENIPIIANEGKFVRISLDTVWPDRYQLIRGTSLDVDALENNLRHLVLKRNQVKSDLLIGAQIVYYCQSPEEIEDTILFCQKCGLDFIQIRPVDNVTGDTLNRQYSFYSKHAAMLEIFKRKYSTERFAIHINQNKFDEYYSSSVEKKYKQCLGGNFTISVGHDMNLYYCCANIGNLKCCIGNLREQRLNELLHSDKRKKYITNPDWQYCQMQCRNHKINKILCELQKLSTDEVIDIIANESKLPKPMHYEFL